MRSSGGSSVCMRFMRTPSQTRPASGHCRRWVTQLIFGLLVSAITFGARATSNTTNGGDLFTNGGNDGPKINDTQLRDWINEAVPAESKRLLVLAQCYGGNMLPLFRNDTNTAITSATSQGQLARNNGYHRGASRALLPYSRGDDGQTVVTGRAVHEDGVRTRDGTSESPQTGGGLPLTGVDLGNIKADGSTPVKSRHVLIYAGSPNSHDSADRDRIRSAYANEPNTTVTTVGGNGTGGWDHPATAEGLRKGLADIKKEFDKAADKSKEQFILYVGDHGSTYNKSPAPAAPAPSGGFWRGFLRGLLGPGGFFLSEASPSQLRDDPDNVPGFSAFVSIDSSMQYRPGVDPDPFAPGSFSLTTRENGAVSPLLLTNYQLQPLNLDTDGSGVIGDRPGEGVNVFFPIDEETFISRFFTGDPDIDNIEFSLLNNTALMLTAGDFLIDTGELARPDAVPEPGGALLLLLAGWSGMIRTNRRREAGLAFRFTVAE